MSRRLWSILLIMGGFSILSAQSDFLMQSVSAAGGRGPREAYLEQFQAGESAMSACRYDAAIRSYEAALAIQADQVRPRFRLAQALIESGRPAESLPHFECLLAQAPQNIPARVLLSRALIDTGRGAEAARHLEWILQVQPGHSEAVSLLSRCRPAVQPVPTMQAARAAVAGGVDADAAFPTVTVAAGAGQRAPASGFQPLQQTASPRVGRQSPKAGTPVREFVPAGFEPLPVQTTAAAPTEGMQVPAKGAAVGAMRRAPEMELPPDAAKVDGWRVSDFMQAASGSLPVVLGYATYCIEKDDLKKADEYLDRAEGLAIELRQTKRFLEVQIHKSLVTLYKADIDGFGRQLIKVKPLLSKQTYLSFLDVYNKTRTATGPVDVARIVAGVAMGAEHYAVAARILKEVVQALPDDLLAANLLSEAQLECRDFAGAERTLAGMTRRFPNDAEAHFNLARFYLTARFMPEAAQASLEAATRLRPGDPRVTIVSALLEYAQGDLQSGLARLKKALPGIKESSMRAICQRIIADGEAASRPGGPAIDFAGMLALPGSPAATPEAVNLIGEQYLKRGSYFSALRCYMETRDLAEIGRGYLAIASSLASSGEAQASAVAAGFGTNALQEAIRQNPRSARAHLYLALYHFERRELAPAKAAANAGLSTGVRGDTQRHLKALLDGMRG